MGAGASGAPAAASAGELLVADSFRVRARDGVAEARGIALHLARFRRSALEAASERGNPGQASFGTRLDAFIESAPGTIAAGAGFPRLELWADASGSLRLAIAARPLPSLGEEIELRSVAAVPATPHPERKGPGIAAYAELRRALGAEPLLIDVGGSAVEGGTTSLLWWEGDEARFSASTERVDSVTERLVRGSLAAAGVRVAAASATPEELAATEVWALNALHGIRRVAAIDGRQLPAPDAARLAGARAALDGTWAPVTGASTSPA